MSPQSSNHLPGDVAPLPSPTATTRTGAADQYFPSLDQASEQMPNQSDHPHFKNLSQSQSQSQPQTSSHLQQQDPSPQAPYESLPQDNPTSAQLQKQDQPQPHAQQQRQSRGNGAASDSSLRLQDFSLLAEAAKRAQVAVVARDLDEITL